MKKKIAVMSLCFTTLLYMVLTVAVADLLAAFPDTPADTVLLVLMLPNLTGIVGIIAIPFLARRLSSKSLSLLGLVLLCAGGAMCLLFHHSLAVLLAAGCVMGLAYGIISTLYPMLVNAYFSGAERIEVMGVCAGMLQLGRLASSLIGGYLARAHWYNVYWTFGFALIALVLVVLLLPKDREPEGSQADGGDAASLRKGSVWKLSFFAAAFACLYFVISTDGSLYIEGHGLGASDLTGWLNSLSCGVAGGVVAALYGRISRLSGRFTLAAAFGLIGVGYLFAGSFVGLFGAVIAFLAGALATALFTPWLMTAISDAAGSHHAPTATAIVLTCVNVGYFVSPYVTEPLGLLFGGGSAAAFAAAGTASLAFCLVTMLLCKKRPLA